MNRIPNTKIPQNGNQEQKTSPQNEGTKYVPQYKTFGITPAEYKGRSVMPGNTTSNTPPPYNSSPNQVAQTQYMQPNPRVKRPMINMEMPTAPSPNTDPALSHLNVGNNLEHNWSDLEDANLDPNMPMIDNNDYINPDPEYIPAGYMASYLEPQQQGKVVIDTSDLERQSNADIHNLSNNNSNSVDDLLPIISDLNDNEYLLLVSGTAILSGPMQEIEEQVSLLIFGQHELCDGEPIDKSEIMVIKKIQIKMGVFLD